VDVFFTLINQAEGITIRFDENHWSMIVPSLLAQTKGESGTRNGKLDAIWSNRGHPKEIYRSQVMA
jgi:hypothetical protein